MKERKRPARWQIWNAGPSDVTERRLYRGDEYLARAWRKSKTEWRWEFADGSKKGAAYRKAEAETEARDATKAAE